MLEQTQKNTSTPLLFELDAFDPFAGRGQSAPFTLSGKNIVNRLIEQFLINPFETRQIAEQFGLWQPLYDAVWRPINQRICQNDVGHFLEYVLIDPETRKRVIQQPFHQEWQDLITRHNRILIGAPRGHGKSVQIAGRIVWELGKNADLRVKIIGSSDDKAQEILSLVHQLITLSPEVREVFPNLLIDYELGDTKSKFFIKRRIQQRDASVEASGVLSAGAGGRADLLICDDVVDMKNSVINPALRETVIRTVKETWFSLVSSTGKVVWICTPYHIADASHDLKHNGGKIWTTWWTPAITYVNQLDAEGLAVRVPQLDADGLEIVDPFTQVIKLREVMDKIILWPGKWSEEKLTHKEEEIGHIIFARQYLLRAQSDEERTFPEKSIKNSFDRSLAYIGEGIDDDWPTYCGVDLASALGKKNAYTVCWTIAKNPENGRLYLKEMYREKIGFSDTITEMKRLFRKHKWRFGYVENNGYQRAVIDALEHDKEAQLIPVEGFTTGAGNKANELVGLPGMNVAFEKGVFAIPAARFDQYNQLPSDDGSDLSIFLEELRSHPGGEFSDTIMALWFAYRAALTDNGDFEDAYMEALLI